MQRCSNLHSIERKLRQDEVLLWKGRPPTGIKLRRADIFLIPFSLIWGGIAIFVGVPALRAIPTDNLFETAFLIFVIPLILIGLYLIFGRFIVDAKNREKTEYAITNQRIIIKSGILLAKVKSINLRSISEISLTERRDGSGIIAFYKFILPWGMPMLYLPGYPHPFQAPAFEMIENVRQVYELAQKAHQKAKY